MSLATAISGTVVVTGAASGIGRALVGELARRGAARVVAADRDEGGARETAAAAGERVSALALDVADEGAVHAAVRNISLDRGAITGWFSNAGVNVGEGLGTAAEWRRAIDVNLLAHVHAADAVLPAMERAGAGAFVVTASAAGLMMDLRTATYTATKHAAVGLSEWLAVSVAEGVSIHCVCPEGVRTAMTRASSEGAAAAMAFLSADQVAAAILDGVERGDFIILTHPDTADYERRRTGDRPRWLAGMRRARTRTLGLDRLFPEG